MSLSTGIPRLTILACLYAAVLWMAGLLSLGLRFDFVVPPEYRVYALSWPAAVALKLVLLAAFGQFAGLLSYFSIPDFKRIVYAMFVASLILFGVRYVLPRGVFVPPRGVVLTDFVISVGGLTGLRLFFRTLREGGTGGNGSTVRRRVAIVGAGDAGAQLALELANKRGLGLRPVAFFDDDSAKHGINIHGIPVVGAPEMLRTEIQRLELAEVIIAMPSAHAHRVGEVIRICRDQGIRCETVPSLTQLAMGRVRVSQLREVDIEDLLGRQPVKLDTDNIRALLNGRVVMVTGAGGSIGSELCRQIASFAPRRLLLVDQSEVQLFPVEQELIGLGHGNLIVPLVADIVDTTRIRQLLARFQPAVIFHAAAHKHVPMMESQPGEALKNNSLGTAGLAELALEAGVDRFVLISTDKAINPTSVMGASKRLAEIFLQALHATAPDRTRFMAVRFGNVLGSSGSVVPIFKRQIAAGGPVTVTHPEVTRYFMTIPEAVGLVLQSAALGSGGEIFVLDMGEPVKIVDLARQLIELSGLRPKVDIEIQFTGLRPGEKMFEEISHNRENLTPTSHPKVMRFVTQPRPLTEVREVFDRFRAAGLDSDAAEVKRLLKEAVPEYCPFVP